MRRGELRQPFVTSAIVGASRASQLEDGLQGVDLALENEEIRACDEWFSLPRERDPQVARR